MRVFTTLCKDDKTGHQMILSECTYNMSCDWLDNKCKKAGVEICGLTSNRYTGLIELYTGKPDSKGLNLCRKYFYDEERGYLLGE